MGATATTAIERALPLLTPEARDAAGEAPGGYLDLLGPSGERASDEHGPAQPVSLLLHALRVRTEAPRLAGRRPRKPRRCDDARDTKPGA